MLVDKWKMSLGKSDGREMLVGKWDTFVGKEDHVERF